MSGEPCSKCSKSNGARCGNCRRRNELCQQQGAWILVNEERGDATRALRRLKTDGRTDAVTEDNGKNGSVPFDKFKPSSPGISSGSKSAVEHSSNSMHPVERVQVSKSLSQEQKTCEGMSSSYPQTLPELEAVDEPQGSEAVPKYVGLSFTQSASWNDIKSQAVNRQRSGHFEIGKAPWNVLRQEGQQLPTRDDTDDERSDDDKARGS